MRQFATACVALALIWVMPIRELTAADDELTERLLYSHYIKTSLAAWEAGGAVTALELLERAPHRMRGWEYGYLSNFYQSGRRTLKGHNGTVKGMAVSRDGQRLASCSADGTVKIWDLASGDVRLTIRGDSKREQCVAFSPDGNRVATGGEDHTVKVWDAATGQELQRLLGHTNAVRCVAFSPDGTRIASGGGTGTTTDDQTVKLWDTTTGQEVLALRGLQWTAGVAFSPDGTRIAGGGTNGPRESAKVWDAKTGEVIQTLARHPLGSVYCIAYSPDGTKIVGGGWDRTITVWDATTGQEQRTFRGHRSIVNNVAWSADGKWIVSGEENETIKVWEESTGRELKTVRTHTIRVNSVAITPDGTQIVSGGGVGTGNYDIEVWDALNCGEPLAFQGHSNFTAVMGVAYSPDGTKIASVDSGRQESLKLWDSTTGQAVRTLRGHDYGGSSVAFSPDGSRLVTSGSDRTVRIWDAASGEELREIQGHGGRFANAVFTPDGKQIISGGGDYTARIWDLVAAQEVRMIRLKPNAPSARFDPTAFGLPEQIYCLQNSPDAKRIVTGGGSGLQNHAIVWDLETGSVIHKLQGHSSWIVSATFSPNVTLIATGSEDRTIKLWNATTGELRQTLLGHGDRVNSVVFSPDGTRIVSGSSDETVKVWDAVTGLEIVTLPVRSGLQTPREPRGGIRCLAFSPDGTRLVAGRQDGVVMLWDGRMPVRE